MFHPNQLIPFMTTSFPVWSTMRPFLVVRKGAFEAAAGERAAAESFFLLSGFFKGGRKERKEERKKGAPSFTPLPDRLLFYPRRIQ